jgi:hypothetical protein
VTTGLEICAAVLRVLEKNHQLIVFLEGYMRDGGTNFCSAVSLLRKVPGARVITEDHYPIHRFLYITFFFFIHLVLSTWQGDAGNDGHF